MQMRRRCDRILGSFWQDVVFEHIAWQVDGMCISVPIIKCANQALAVVFLEWRRLNGALQE